MTPERVVIGNAELFHGDCRDVLPLLPKVDAVITDPPWDMAKGIPGSDDPRGLFAAVAPLLRAERYVVQLGCDCDPAFLAPLAALHPYLRTCWLEYACPSYKGRLLATGDVAFAYGAWPPAEPGKMVIPGKCMSARSNRDFVRGPRKLGKELGGWEALEHPMPRRLEHVAWLVNWFARGVVLDPCMGSGTTGVACVNLDRRFIGIEIERRYFDIACERIEAAQRQARMFDGEARQA